MKMFKMVTGHFTTWSQMTRAATTTTTTTVLKPLIRSNPGKLAPELLETLKRELEIKI